MTVTSPEGRLDIIFLTTVVFPEPVPPAIPIISIFVVGVIGGDKSFVVPKLRYLAVISKFFGIYVAPYQAGKPPHFSVGRLPWLIIIKCE